MFHNMKPFQIIGHHNCIHYKYTNIFPVYYIAKYNWTIHVVLMQTGNDVVKKICCHLLPVFLCHVMLCTCTGSTAVRTLYCCIV